MSNAQPSLKIIPLLNRRFLLLFLLCWVFFYAGGVKICNGDAFFDDIQNYRILNREGAWALALYLPWLELLTAGALLWPRFRSASLFVSAGLLLVFLGAIISAWSRGLNINCGCFGSGTELAHYPTLVLRDLALLAITGVLMFWDARNLSGDEKITNLMEAALSAGVPEVQTE